MTKIATRTIEMNNRVLHVEIIHKPHLNNDSMKLVTFQNAHKPGARFQNRRESKLIGQKPIPHNPSVNQDSSVRPITASIARD
uniref:Uncharacterized protein n=1 Tax=Rhizophora mucronata TaxID=61149 RepID=A0A2P2NKS4_RHIMU